MTTREYDAATRFRNHGGDLIFLSANNFFWRINLSGNVTTRTTKWRDLGRPEAGLIGVQYLDWNHDYYTCKPYVVRAARSWIFHGTGLRNGDRFGAGGIEIDHRTAASPPGTQVLATIPNVFGPANTAEMTYYERGSARVFASGAFTLAGSIDQRPVRQIIENLWVRLAPHDPAEGET